MLFGLSCRKQTNNNSGMAWNPMHLIGEAARLVVFSIRIL